MFKKGDVVKCVQPSDCPSHILIYQKLYTVAKDSYPVNLTRLEFVELDGVRSAMYADRFQLHTPAPQPTKEEPKMKPWKPMTLAEIAAVTAEALANPDRVVQYSRLGSQWINCTGNGPCWEFTNTHYRLKPEPVVPMEVWVNQYIDGSMSCYSTEEVCKKVEDRYGRIVRTIHFREVLPNGI